MDNKLFDKLRGAEEGFLSSQFVSPVIRYKPIKVRIAGIVVSLVVTKPKRFQGWGIFSPRDYSEARFVRNPTIVERQEYTKLFPSLRLIICRREDEQYLGFPAQQNDSRFRIKGLVPIWLADGIQQFDVVRVCFDGINCWFIEIDSRSSPKNSQYLRDSLVSLLEPNKLILSGLTQEERDAYQLAYGPALAADIESKRDKTEDRLKWAVERAGAKFRGYTERDTTYTIEYMVGHDRMRSVVNKDTLQVESAGICLSGGDKAFDLQSLVPVIKEGQQRRAIRHLNYDDDDEY